MKILFSAYVCGPYSGTEGGNGWNWAYYMANKGLEVWCLTRETCIEDVRKKMMFLNLTNLHFEVVKLPNWVEQLYRFRLGMYFNYFFWQHRAYLLAKKLDKQFNFDVVHHTTWGSLILGSEMWKLKKPMVFGPVGGGQTPPKKFKKYFYEYWRSEIIRAISGKIFLRINPNVKATLRRSKLVLTANKETYDIAKNVNSRNLRMFLDTSLPEEFFPRLLPEKLNMKTLKILWVGRLYALKGLPLVLEALSKVREDIQFKLTIAGDGPMSKYLPGWLDQYNLNQKVSWLGQISWDEVRKVYLENDVFLFCSLRDSTGAQLLEAMAFGLPIITLNHHGARFLVPENAGIKVEVTDVDTTVKDIAAAVNFMYDHPQKRKEFSINSYVFAKSQSWLIKTDKIRACYDQIIKNAPLELNLF